MTVNPSSRRAARGHHKRMAGPAPSDAPGDVLRRIRELTAAGLPWGTSGTSTSSRKSCSGDSQRRTSRARDWSAQSDSATRAAGPGSSVPILTPRQGEFLIGDAPALTVRNDRAAVGVLGGITLDDAHSVFLPLGPHHVAALGKANLTAELSPEQVWLTNARQVAGAIECASLRPGSGLHETVRSLLARPRPVWQVWRAGQA
jgi:hypothetical protein